MLQRIKSFFGFDSKAWVEDYRRMFPERCMPCRYHLWGIAEGLAKPNSKPPKHHCIEPSLLEQDMENCIEPSLLEQDMEITARELPETGILQEWVAGIGLRYQGVLLSIIRGCDTEPKHSPRKSLTRSLRGLILNTHCADPKQAKSFIEYVDDAELQARFSNAFDAGWDELPHHYVMHVVHAVQVLGYYHPDSKIKRVCLESYIKFCKKLHLNCETKQQLAERLEADENAFAYMQ